MKALSIKQPWASLIAYGIKDIEKTWRKDPEEFKKQIEILKGDTEVSNG
jgi:hypothetical protein